LKTNGFFRRLTENYRRFLYGRYGHDNLNRFISFAALALCVFSFIFRSSVFPISVLAMLLITIYRSLSKNVARRRRENEFYLRASKPVKHFFKYWLARVKMRKTHSVFTCEKCNSILRVPRSAGAASSTYRDKRAAANHPAARLEIICPKCNARFKRRV